MISINQLVKHNEKLFDIYSAKHIVLDGILFNATYINDGDDSFLLNVPNQEENRKLLDAIPWIINYIDDEYSNGCSYATYSMDNIYSSIETVTSLYLTVCDMMLRSTKKYQTFYNKYSNDYSYQFVVPDMDDDVVNISYCETTHKINIRYHDRECDNFFGDFDKFNELVDRYYTGITSSQGLYVFDHILSFDTYR